MIETRKDLRYYLQKDAELLGVNRNTLRYKLFGGVKSGNSSAPSGIMNTGSTVGAASA